jgi:hypothetical protein
MIIFDNKIFTHIPKCAGVSILNRCQDDPQKIHYISQHDTLDLLESSYFDFAKDFQIFTLIRNPISWYNSLYNFIGFTQPFKNKHDMVIYSFLLYDDDKLVSYNEFIQRSLFLNDFFEDKKDELRLRIIQNKNGYAKFYFGDLQKLTLPSTLYDLFIDKLINKKTKVFRMEDQMQNFLEETQLKYLPRNNITNYNINNTKESNQLIYKRSKYIFERFGYGYIQE